MIRLVPKDLDFIKSEEEFVDHWYDDAKGPHVKLTLPAVGFITGGWGHRQLKGEDSIKVITYQIALCWLSDDIEIVENAVSKLVNIATTHNQYLACCDLVYTCGADAFKKSDTRRVINTGDVPAIIERWKTAFITLKGVRMPGLVNRRAREAKLWETVG